MSDIEELRRLNNIECDTIIAGLQKLAGNNWAAKVLLENDAEFVRGLFWTSKRKKAEASNETREREPMSDREQAIDDVAKHLRCEIDAVIEACKEDELAMKYAVAQRERVIALERALREAFGAMNYMGDILNGMDAVLPEDAAKITPAFATVRAALGDH